MLTLFPADRSLRCDLNISGLSWERARPVPRPHLLLDEEAVTAVWQWKYSSMLLNGEPVAVITPVTMLNEREIGMSLHFSSMARSEPCGGQAVKNTPNPGMGPGFRE
jgi:hypothetical protein